MSTTPRDRSFWPRVLLALVMVAFMIVCVVGLIAVKRKPGAIFNVTVTTERLSFERPIPSQQRWTFQGARLETAGNTTPSFTGSIELDTPVRGFIERIGEGPLWVHVECTSRPPCQVGRVFSDKDAVLFVAGPTLDIWIGNVKQAAERGITTVLTLSGTITPGREVGIETLGSTAILREGSVAYSSRPRSGQIDSRLTASRSKQAISFVSWIPTRAIRRMVSSSLTSGRR